MTVYCWDAALYGTVTQPAGYHWTEPDGWVYWLAPDGQHACFDDAQVGFIQTPRCWTENQNNPDAQPCYQNYSYLDEYGVVNGTDGSGSQWIFGTEPAGPFGPLQVGAGNALADVVVALLAVGVALAALLAARRGVGLVRALLR